MCQHQPSCPPAEAPDRVAARVVTAHPEQGWSLLCNGVVLFEDAGALLPGGQAVAPRSAPGRSARRSPVGQRSAGRWQRPTVPAARLRPPRTPVPSAA